MRRSLLFLTLVTLGLFFGALAEPSNAGVLQDGQNGVAGDPGTDGQDGTDGTDGVGEDGTDGFHGGDGGDGIDGDDEDSVAAGGNGGNGGAGGHSFVRRKRDVKAIAGKGGNGGMGGRGTQATLNGQGGNGGHGGNAAAWIEFDNTYWSTKSMSATAGQGGSARGSGALAGNGGNASAGIIGQSSNFRRLVTTLVGGHGGEASDGATSGRGGHALYGFSPQQFQWSATDFSPKVFDFDLFGGNGGNTNSGIGGRAGTARFSLEAIAGEIDQFTDRTGWDLRADVRGGYGGKGIANGFAKASGGRGAIGLVKAASVPLNRTFLAFQVRGGNGGSALGRYNSGDGGHGAAAVLDGTLLFDNAEYGFNQSASVELRGGAGGHAQGTGRAGNGASVELIDAISIQNQAFIANTSFWAFGGNGGWGRNNGNGGNATIQATNPVLEVLDSQFNLANPGRAGIEVRAYGGDAGRGVVPINSAHGGDAEITISQHANRSVYIQAIGAGGQGNFGADGNVTVDIEGVARRSAGEFEQDMHRFAEVRAWANVSGGYSASTKSSIGSNAYARAIASAEGLANDRVNADARAFGGYGYLHSGSAEAIADATNLEGLAQAYATSLALGDSNLASDNYSIAQANGRSQSLVRTVASAHGSGLTSRIQSTTSATGPEIQSSSFVQSNVTAWEHNVRVLSKGEYLAESGQQATLTTGSGFRFRGTEFAATGQDVSADLLFVPDQTWASSTVENSSNLDSFFGSGVDSDILGIGQVHVGMADLNSDGVLSTETNLNFDFQVREFHNDKNLVFGLYETEATGAGFSELSLLIDFNGSNIVDEQFMNLADAQAFFASPWFDLGAMPGDRQMIEFDISLMSTIESADDAYGFGFVFGNANVPGPMFSRFSAVPEPGTAGVLALAGLLLAARRRRSS